jgi:hypothetical protein
MLQMTSERRVLAAIFVAICAGLALLMAVALIEPNNGVGVGVPIEMIVVFLGFAVVGLGGFRSQVVCDAQWIWIRNGFRTRPIDRREVESITGGRIRTNGIADSVSVFIGVRIKVRGRKKPFIPFSLKTYDTAKNRALLDFRLRVLTCAGNSISEPADTR